MAGFCLKTEDVNKFKRALKDRTLDPEKLVDMTSDERRAELAKIIGGDNAKAANQLFESKMLLKNVQQGMVTWAKTVAGMKPAVKRDIISRIERMDERILDPAEEKLFLKDLAAQKIGAGVSFDEVKQINEMVDKVKGLEQYKGQNAPDATPEQRERGLEYGRAVTALNNYVADRKLASRTTWGDIRDQQGIGNKTVFAVKKAALDTASNAKAIQASMDDSAIFRQGWKAMWTHPGIWAKNSLKSFSHLAQAYKSVDRQHNDVINELNADIVSRPTYDLMKRAKLDVGTMEEAYPTTLPEKVPGLGRIYKATENAFTAFVHKTRADVFDKYVKIASENGVDLNDQELQSIGKMVNSLTGRGHLGRFEPVAGATNVLFFSPKLLKSHWDVLTQPVTGAGGSSFVRKQAAVNLLKMVAGTAAVMGVAKMIAPNSVETDPRSSDFGKIKVGNTRFDVTGGMSSLLTLISRIATQTTKSSKGDLRDLTKPEYGKQNLVDVVENFFENKLSPAMSLVKDFAKGETFEGYKPTVAGETVKLFTPLPLNTIIDVMSDPQARKDKRFAALAVVADMLGVNVNTYNQRPTGTSRPTDLTHLLQQLKAFLPEEKPKY